MPTPDAILEFWFGQLDDDGLADEATSQRWFKKDPDFDAEIRERFLEVYENIAKGELDDWNETPHGRLAVVIVLDQFSRNMFRDDKKMYAMDRTCQDLVLAGLSQDVDQYLKGHQRVFFYMPLMHAEQLRLQNRCVALFEEMVRTASPRQKDRFMQNVEFAKRHRDIIERFSRFPHRNDILGRKSTPEEEAFLKEPGSSF